MTSQTENADSQVLMWRWHKLGRWDRNDQVCHVISECQPPISQMRKLRPEDGEWLVPGHTVSGTSWVPQPRLPTLHRSCAFPLVLSSIFGGHWGGGSRVLGHAGDSGAEDS